MEAGSFSMMRYCEITNEIKLVQMREHVHEAGDMSEKCEITWNMYWTDRAPLCGFCADRCFFNHPCGFAEQYPFTDRHAGIEGDAVAGATDGEHLAERVVLWHDPP